MSYASRSITETEIRYAQIKKECLGLTYVSLLCIWTYTAEADRCPLVSIIKKNLNEMLLRIPRLDMKVQRYDFELLYTPGKHLVLPNTLSTAPENNQMSSTEK